jgi:esterase/lipase superfamily enzyme
MVGADLMRRDYTDIPSPAIGGEGTMGVFGHWGRPVLVFPSEQGRAWDFENNGMVESVSALIEDGRVKLYCIDSFDAGTWNRDDLPLEQRAQLHGGYEDWILNQVVPWIHNDCGGAEDILAVGSSFGAYHAANFALKHAHLFPQALCLSGVYDVSRVGWGERGESVYFNNPMDYVTHLQGDHLDWLRSKVFLLLVCGQGQWEDTTGALEGTKAFSSALASKQIPHEMDLWGHDIPHDWPSWRKQFAQHLPRFS